MNQIQSRRVMQFCSVYSRHDKDLRCLYGRFSVCNGFQCHILQNLNFMRYIYMQNLLARENELFNASSVIFHRCTHDFTMERLTEGGSWNCLKEGQAEGF